jgi:hypothetical protein
MQRTFTKVIDFPTKSPPPAASSNRDTADLEKVSNAIIIAARGDRRVQVRVCLDTLEQTEKDLTILQNAVEKALTHVRSGRRRRDDTALAAVRQLLMAVNKMINARGNRS